MTSAVQSIDSIAGAESKTQIYKRTLLAKINPNQSHLDHEQILDQIANDNPSLLFVLSNASDKFYARSNNIKSILEGYQKYPCPAFTDLLNNAEGENIIKIVNYLHKNHCSQEQFNTFVEILSFVGKNNSGLFINTLMSACNKGIKNFDSFDVLVDQIAECNDFADKIYSCKQLLSKPTAQGKKQSGHSQLENLLRGVPIHLIVPLIHELSSLLQEESAKDSSVNFSQYVKTMHEIARKIPSNTDLNNQTAEVFQQLAKNIFILYTNNPRNGNAITETIKLFLEGSVSLNSLSGISSDIKDWSDYKSSINSNDKSKSDFYDVVTGETFYSLTKETGCIQKSLKAINFIETFLEEESGFNLVSRVLTIISAMPIRRSQISNPRLLQDVLVQYASGAYNACNKLQLKHEGFKEWLLDKEKGLSAILNAYGQRPDPVKLKNLIEQLGVIHESIKTVRSEKSFWSKIGGRSLRAVDALHRIAKSNGGQLPSRSMEVVNESARDFFRIIHSDVKPRQKKILLGKAELDDAQTKYVYIVESLLKRSEMPLWHISHVASAVIVDSEAKNNSGKFSTKKGYFKDFNFYTNSLDKISKSHYLINLEDLKTVFQKQIDITSSLKIFDPIFNLIREGGYYNCNVAAAAVSVVLKPIQDKANKDIAFKADEIKAAIEIGKKLVDKNLSEFQQGNILFDLQNFVAKSAKEKSAEYCMQMLNAYDQAQNSNLAQLLLIIDEKPVSKYQDYINNLQVISEFQNKINKDNFKTEEKREFLSVLLDNLSLFGKDVKPSVKIITDWALAFKEKYDVPETIYALRRLMETGNKSEIPLEQLISVIDDWSEEFHEEDVHEVVKLFCVVFESNFLKDSKNIPLYGENLKKLRELVLQVPINQFNQWVHFLMLDGGRNLKNFLNDNGHWQPAWKAAKLTSPFTDDRLFAPLAANLSSLNVDREQMVDFGGISTRLNVVRFSRQDRIGDLQNDSQSLIAVKNEIYPISKPRNKTDQMSDKEAARILAANKITEALVKLSKPRNENDKVQFVRHLIIDLYNYQNSNKPKDKLHEAVIKFSYVWSNGKYSRQSLGRMSLTKFREILQEFELSEIIPIAEQIWTKAASGVVQKTFAYYEEQQDKFNLSLNERNEKLRLLEEKIQPSKRIENYTDANPVLDSSDDSLPRQQAMLRLYAQPSPETPTNEKGFSGPSQEELERQKLVRVVNAASRQDDSADTKTILNKGQVKLQAQDLLKSIISANRNIEEAAQLIEDNLPLFLFDVTKGNFTAKAINFIERELPEILGYDPSSQSKIVTAKIGLILKGESTESIKDREFLLQVQNKILSRIGLAPIEIPENDVSKTRLKGDENEKLAELCWEVWYRKLGENNSVQEVILTALGELKDYPVQYESLIRQSVGALIEERNPGFFRVLNDARDNPNNSSLLFVNNILNGFLAQSNSGLSRLLQDEDAKNQEKFPVLQKEWRLLSQLTAEKIVPENLAILEIENVNLVEVRGRLRDSFVSDRSSKRVFIASDSDSEIPLAVFEYEDKKHKLKLIHQSVPLMIRKKDIPNNKKNWDNLEKNIVDLILNYQRASFLAAEKPNTDE